MKKFTSIKNAFIKIEVKIYYKLSKVYGSESSILHKDIKIEKSYY